MNVTDKYILSTKIKNWHAYIPMIGIAQLVFVSILIPFLDWSNLPMNAIIYPVIAALFNVICVFVVIPLIQKTDICHLVGFIYAYPIIVAILSYFFLGELLSSSGYFAIFLIIMGIFTLTIRIKHLNCKVSWFSLGLAVLLTALNEFTIKISTNNMNEWNALSISVLTYGVCLCLPLVYKKHRNSFLKNILNIKYVFLSELFSFFGIITLFLAIARLPVTVATAIFSVQPMFVLILEGIVDSKISHISQDHKLLPKLGSILLIVVGLILLYLQI